MTAKAPGRGPGAARDLLFLFLAVPLPEQQGNAPQARYAHQGIDDAAESRQLAAAEKRYAVEGEKAHAAPVQRADDDQNQRDAVNDLQRVSLRFLTGYMA